jgi:hypothetical protein
MFAHIFKGPSERPLHATTTAAIRSKPIAPGERVGQTVKEPYIGCTPNIVYRFATGGKCSLGRNYAFGSGLTNFPMKRIAPLRLSRIMNTNG